MPSPYANTGVVDQRDAITRALMNISSPPPQTPMPQMPQQTTPQMGMPQMPPQGAPPQGMPIGGGTVSTQMPLAPGVSPQGGVPQQTGMAPVMPQGMPPGASLGASPQMPQPGMMPQGPQR